MEQESGRRRNQLPEEGEESVGVGTIRVSGADRELSSWSVSRYISSKGQSD